MRISAISLILTTGLIACEKHPSYIKVKVPQASIHSTRSDPVLPAFEKKGDTIKLRASAFYKDDSYMGPPKKTEWSSSDSSVATVGVDGLVTIVSSGKADIIATTKAGDKTLDAKLPVEAVIIKRVEIVPPEELGENNSIHMGDTVKFQAKVFNDRDQVIPDAKVKWRTSDYAATVGADGTVEGRSIGDTQVIAEAGEHNKRFVINVLDWRKTKKSRRR
ncbi:MAG: Ig-like domain-containing protein [Myxococcota bacterium]|nr:Ig-like domain-containing protein [Myxococcota bacterium]